MFDRLGSHSLFTNLIDSRRTLDPVFLTLKCEIAIPCMAKSIILNNLLCILVLKMFDLKFEQNSTLNLLYKLHI